MSENQFKFDTSSPPPALDYLRGIRNAREAGKGQFGMLWEIVRLRLGQGKLLPEEYFLYGLYDDSRFTPEIKRTYLSRRNLSVMTAWADVAKDKPTLTALLRGLDLPVPETQAIVHRHRTFSGALALREHDQIGRFLREQAKYPIFGKPFDGACSVGTVEIRGYDSSQDALILPDDTLVEVESLVKLVEQLGDGYLFQTLMLSHESMVPLIGPRVSSVRMFVISDEEGCSLLRASWKIPGDENGADNFWRPGNILAGIDVESGRVIKTLLRTEEGTEAVLTHPKTGANFENLIFPHWDEMRETVLKAAVNLPDCPFQGWDVALTDQGPVLVEIEGNGGDPIMEQLCFESGLLQGRYKRVVDNFANRKKRERKETKDRRRTVLRQNIAALAQPAPSTLQEQSDSQSLPVNPDANSPIVIAPVSADNPPVDSSVSV